jgi:hypothetical protein
MRRGSDREEKRGEGIRYASCCGDNNHDDNDDGDVNDGEE